MSEFGPSVTAYAVVVKTTGIDLARAAASSRWTPGMITSMPSQVNGLPSRVHAFARSMLTRAGRSPKPILRMNPRPR